MGKREKKNEAVTYKHCVLCNYELQRTEAVISHFIKKHGHNVANFKTCTLGEKCNKRRPQFGERL